MAVLVGAVLAVAPSAFADPIVVSNTNDSGAGSLRQAILDANAAPGPATITFALSPPSSGEISPQGALPTITNDVTIDGSTELAPDGTPFVQIDGKLSDGSGLEFAQGLASEVEDVSVTHWSTAGILIDANASATVLGSYIGTDPAGDSGLNAVGIEANGPATIGAPSAGNVIEGNDIGVKIAATSATVVANTIGSHGLQNGTGVEVTSPENSRITVKGNTIEFNKGPGVHVVNPASGVTITQNAIEGNDDLGIALDEGANGGQSAPVLSAADENEVGTHVDGTLDSLPDNDYTVDFYASDSCDDSGFGQGATYIGTTDVSTDGQGSASFSVNVDAASGVVTATATSETTNDDGSTSEFSACETISGGSQEGQGALGGSIVTNLPAPSTHDLTQLGSEDWAIWGLGANTSLAPDVRKAGGDAISDLTDIELPTHAIPLRALGGLNVSPPPFEFNWSDGDSQPTGQVVEGGLQHDGEQTQTDTVGYGFSFDVPADTTPRTLRIFLATNRAEGALSATLSDSSAPEFDTTLPIAADTDAGVVTITYQAASANQTLHVKWVESVNNCSSQFSCDNAALFAVTLSGVEAATGAQASLGTDASVGMSGSNDSIESLPLAAFDPSSAGGGTPTVNGLPINTLPINTLPINTLPINTLPINTLPINTLPINTLPINTLPINTLPLDELPINTLGGWAAVLAGTPLANLPLQSVTLAQVLALNPLPAAVQNLDLGQLDVSQSALGRVSIGALSLGATPINTLGFSADQLAGLQAWCATVPACTAASLAGSSLFALSLEGAPINTLPIKTLPINTLPINTLPINTLPINTLDLSASPINTLPINTLTTGATAINTLSLRQILGATNPDGGPSPFAAIPISALGTPAAVVDCSLVDCTSATLGDAYAAGAILAGAQLGDILDAVGSLTLGDLHYYDSLTIGDLEQSLPGSTTLGDLLGLLILRADVPWETLPARALSAFDMHRPELNVTAGVQLSGTGAASGTVKVALPDGFDYVAGSSTLQDGTGDAVSLPDPDVNGSTSTWTLPELSLGDQYTLRFHAYSGTDVGPAQATETVTSGSFSDTSTTSFDVTDSFEPNDDPTSASLPTIQPNQNVEQSAISSGTDVDYYKIPLPPAGTRLQVHLTNLPADYDLALYSSVSTSLRTAASNGAPLQDGTIPDQSIDLQGGVNPELAPTALQDVPNPGIPAVQVSANRGTDDEDVGMISPGGSGYALIAVYGYNGAFSPHPYSLRVTTTTPRTLTCPARTFSFAGSGSAGTLPTSIPSDVNTLILVNEKRLGDTYGSAGESSVVSALNQLAADRSLGVSGAVIPVEALAQSQYNTWDSNPCDVSAANAVANTIANEVDVLKAAHPTVKYVVFVGGDDEIPFFRVPDLSLIANEAGFADSFGPNEYYGSLASGDLLSDDPYLDTRPIPASGRQLFVPDLVGGRLVEKPAEIVSAISRFQSSNATLNASTAFVSGYDFVSDGSQLVQQRLNHILGGPVTRTLINNTWSKSDLLSAAFPASGAAAINDWNGHYDDYRALPANGDLNNLITTADIDAKGASALAGGIFFTMGCHAGFQATDAIVGAAAPDARDWAETFSDHGTSFIGNTGFGLGNTDSVAFSEELMADLAQNLDGTMTIGQALANAKDTYYLARTAFSSYDEKTLSEAELYGLPMYGVGVAPAALSATPQHAVRAALTSGSPDPVTGSTTSSSPSQGSLQLLPGTGAQTASFAVAPHFEATPNTGQHGSYFTNDGQAQAPNYRPLQPFVTLPATRTGVVAHGVLIDGLTSRDVANFNPDNVRPTVDLTANEPEPQFADEAWPTKVPALVSLNDTNGLRQNLNLTTGQFFTDDATHTGVERLWTQIGGRVTYSNSTDFVPPSIDSVDAYIAGGVVTFTGSFSDLTETGAPGTVALAQVVYDVDNNGSWQSLSLSRDPSTGEWSGGAPFTGAHVQYFVEACDVAGNCGYSSNKGRYFDAQPLPSQTGSITLTPSGRLGAGPWFTGAVTVAASSSTAASLSVSVDGGPFSVTSSVTLTGDGSHTVDARSSDGSETTGVFLIDTTPPTLHVTCPTTVEVRSAASASFAASDAGGSGLQTPASGTITLDTTHPGRQTSPTVTSMDNAGNSTTGSCTYFVDSPPTVPGKPTTTAPSPNDGAFTLTWAPSSDPDGDTLTYTLLHSNGGAYRTVGTTSAPSYSFSLPPEAQGVWTYEVQVSDGLHTAVSAPSASIVVNRAAISMGPQAMEGLLQVKPGDTLQAGYDFDITGSHAAATVTFQSFTAAFAGQCVVGSRSVALVVPMTDAKIADPAGSGNWYPSSDQQSPLTFQGSLQVGNPCGNGSAIKLTQGGLFTGILSSTTSDRVSVRWHYRANGSAGGWSGTTAFTPGSAP